MDPWNKWHFADVPFVSSMPKSGSHLKPHVFRTLIDRLINWTNRFPTVFMEYEHPRDSYTKCWHIFMCSKDFYAPLINKIKRNVFLLNVCLWNPFREISKAHRHLMLPIHKFNDSINYWKIEKLCVRDVCFILCENRCKLSLATFCEIVEKFMRTQNFRIRLNSYLLILCDLIK